MTGDHVVHTVSTPMGYLAVLRHNNWLRHLAKHPELDGHLENVRLLLSEPDVVIESTDSSHNFYRLGFGTGRVADCFLYAVTREFATDEVGARTVTSAYFTKVLKKGTVIWQSQKS